MWAVLEAGHLGQSWLDWVGSSWDECTSPAYGSRLVEQQATNSHLFAGAAPLQDWWGMECMKNLDRLVWSVGRKWIGIDYNNGEDTAGRGMRACQTRIIRSNPPSQPPPRSRLSLAKLKKKKHLNERNIDLLHLDTSTLPIIHIIEPQPFKISFFPPSLFK